MLTPHDDSQWHQLPTTFDHVGTSDPRFFDRIWFAATDSAGRGTLQFTLGVYQNMNVVDGGIVVIAGGKQHNVRASRQLRPHYETACAPLSVEVIEPMQRLRLRVDPGDHGVGADLEWRATMPAEEEPQQFARRNGRIVEDYKRYDQIGTCHGWVEVDGVRGDVDDWWACRDHSWGVRERVGIPEPVTSESEARTGSGFAFLFFFGGHVQVARRGDSVSQSVVLDGVERHDHPVVMDVEYSDDIAPRRFRRGTFTIGDTRLELDALGPAVAMTGLGYGGYDDGLGLGVYRGLHRVEHDVWDVSHPADVLYPDGGRDRPVHRIQPVRVVYNGVTGTGSLTFIS